MPNPYKASQAFVEAVRTVVLEQSPNNSEQDPEELWEPALLALAGYYDFQGYTVEDVAELALYLQYDLLKWSLGEASIASEAAAEELKKVMTDR